MKTTLAAASVGVGLLLAQPASAQELTYSIAPSSTITIGESPYSKLTRHPNEIYNPSPLLPYRTPEYTYYSFPTFEIRDAELGGNLRPQRQAGALTTTVVARQQTRQQARARQAAVVARQQTRQAPRR